MSFISSIFGDHNQRTLKSLDSLIRMINQQEATVSRLSDIDIKKEVSKIRTELTGNNNDTTKWLPSIFSIVREASRRTIGLRHFDVQIIGGLVLNQGQVAEMKTGEGKTLVATLAATVNALSSQGVHVITVNDYLAKRDAQWMGPVYYALGLTVGCIQHEQAFLFNPDYSNEDEKYNYLVPCSRKEAYQADITYGTNNEFGFDYLRDNMAPDKNLRVQRGLNYAIVDEVDSILIDEARTPLIISAPAEESTDQYYRFAKLVRQLSPGSDYNIDEKLRSATLTEGGVSKLEQWLGIRNFYEVGGVETLHHIEQALRALSLYKIDKDYVIKDGEVVIVDEFTGRLMFGRRYSEGLHQAIEAKEGVDIKKESVTLATISFQNYFRLYNKLSGMTGTAVTEAEELSKIYGLEVVIIPTNKKMIRVDQTDSVYKNERGKYLAVVKEIKRRNELGQPILVGTISIEKNELLHELLEREGIAHELLNAKNHEREASIISQAGKRGAVTLATNMAGRGVDIVLGGTPFNQHEAEFVCSVGGLHVIGTERHESRRIDNQLRGRAGRQGDPGSSQFFVSMEDDLMRIFGSDRLRAMMDRLGIPDDMPIENSLVSKSIEAAQRKVEGHNFDIRKHLVEYDDVMNKHREVIYRKRNELLDADESSRKGYIKEIIGQELSKIVSFHTASEDDKTWDIEEIYRTVDSYFTIDIKERIKLDELRSQAGDVSQDVQARQSIIDYLLSLSQRAYEEIEKSFGSDRMRQVELGVSLRAIDSLWIEHLEMMDYLRRGIGLRGYGQRDPLVEYKKEAYELFTQLIGSINAHIVNTVFRLKLAKSFAEGSTGASMVENRQPMQIINNEATEKLPPSSNNKVGRNDPCPCGSGKKYKKCHGA